MKAPDSQLRVCHEPEIPASAFRFRWQQIWPGAQADFTARKDGGFCRIYHEPGGPNSGRWLWTAAWSTQLGSGHAETPRAAAIEAEALLLGEPFMAEAALEVGLVNRIVPPTEARNLAQAQARKLAAKPAGSAKPKHGVRR